MKRIGILLSFFLISFSGFSQSPFDIYIEPVTVSGLGGLQSYAFAQHNGKWLIIGGRLDGLHQRQPFASFDVSGNNNQLIVIDPVTLQTWSEPLSSLMITLRDQLSSTNMEFHQEGDYLYLIGGYGYSSMAAEHTTYPYLTAVDVPAVINAVVSTGSIIPYFRQIYDSTFAVTGGRLNKIYETYYITGGQRFEGRYNPMNMPTFTQTYTNAIRKFILLDDGVNLTITHLPSIIDAANLHRRDYNVTPQIMPNGQEGLTAFSGVFQVTANIPFLNCVNIDSSGYAVNNSFSQYYNHYHCANIPLFSETNNEMHTVFFGGIAQYYDSLGTLVQDNDVPFVNTIARITRTGNGTMSEYKLPIEMPALLGAGSEFIPEINIPSFKNGVFKLDSLTTDTTLVGYIFGGISSTAQNIFWINNGTQSTASNEIFKVYVVKNISTGISNLNVQSKSNLRMQIYPNPNNGIINIDFNINYKSDIEVLISDFTGKVIMKKYYNKDQFILGANHLNIDLSEKLASTPYLITLIATKDTITQLILPNK